jgi:hypothetical protein
VTPIASHFPENNSGDWAIGWTWPYRREGRVMPNENLLAPPAQPVPRLLLSARDAAKALAVCEKTLWQHTAPRGPIPAVKLGRRVLYALADLEAFIQNQKH